MKLSTHSDLGRLASIQRQASQTRTALDLAGVELSTGQKSDLFKATRGNLTRLFGLDRALERNAVHTEAITLAGTRLEIVQGTLGRIFETTETLSVDLLSSVGLGDIGSARTHADLSRQRFAESVGLLNARFAGQALFAGTATGPNAMAASSAILADLDAAVAGAVTAADAIDAIDAYFAKPGGAFHTSGYLGSDDDLVPVEVADGTRFDTAVRADADEIISALRGHALAAVVAGGAFADDVPSQLNLLRNAGESLLRARDDLSRLRADVGISQNTVERARAERTAERSTLDFARTGILEADQMEVATRFKALEAQLDAVYTVTARLSQLSFANYMR